MSDRHAEGRASSFEKSAANCLGDHGTKRYFAPDHILVPGQGCQVGPNHKLVRIDVSTVLMVKKRARRADERARCKPLWTTKEAAQSSCGLSLLLAARTLPLARHVIQKIVGGETS
mgnify:CR=1 FL=1